MLPFEDTDAETRGIAKYIYVTFLVFLYFSMHRTIQGNNAKVIISGLNTILNAIDTGKRFMIINVRNIESSENLNNLKIL